jgi:hypothetical protein
MRLQLPDIVLQKSIGDTNMSEASSHLQVFDAFLILKGTIAQQLDLPNALDRFV